MQIAACGVCHSDLSGDQRHDPDAAADGARPRGGRHDRRGRRGRDRPQGRRHRRGLLGPDVRQVPLLRRGPARALRRRRPRRRSRCPTAPAACKDAKGNTLNHFAGVGVMAEYATLHRDSVIPIDADVAARQGGARRLRGDDRRRRGDQHREGAARARRWRVFGAGGIGLNVIQGAALAGADKIIAVDLADKKLEFAQRFGATAHHQPEQRRRRGAEDHGADRRRRRLRLRVHRRAEGDRAGLRPRRARAAPAWSSASRRRRTR